MPMCTLAQLREELEEQADSERAAQLQRFFKTGPGEYGEGDRFLGIRVPVLRRLARSYRSLPRAEMLALLRSPWHEERFVALVLLVHTHDHADAREREEIHEAYLAHTRYVNNWDLVDCSAEYLVGPHVTPENLSVLERLARSDVLWERRIAIMATFHFIKRDEFRPTLHVAELLLHDAHDLIHKAVGWMLREVGKRDQPVEEAFLQPHYQEMPRTMLRYAIERFPEPLRQQYLAGEVLGPRLASDE